MKRLLLLSIFSLINLSDLIAQSSHHYLSRNSKLNMKHQLSAQKEDQVKPLKSSERSVIYADSYKIRNQKFHKTEAQPQSNLSSLKQRNPDALTHYESGQKNTPDKSNSTGAKLTKFLTFLLLVGIIVPK